MKSRAILSMCLLSLLLFASCAINIGMGNLSTRIVAASSRVIQGKAGAPIGRAPRLLAGNLVGFSLDAQDKKVIEQSSPRTVDRIEREDPLTINDVIKLSQAGVSDDTIIQYIRERKTPYTLTQPQVRRLQDAGVSQRVIGFMTDTSRI